MHDSPLRPACGMVFIFELPKILKLRYFDSGLWAFYDLCETYFHGRMNLILAWTSGLQGDPDLQFLLKGGDLIKVKS